MTNSQKKGRKQAASRTKAQLARELADAQAAVEEQATKLAAQSRDLQEAKAQIQKLEDQRREVELPEPQLQQPGIATAEGEEVREEVVRDASSPKTTFVLHFYLREGRYHGRIEHPLTRERKVFSGVDRKAIGEFVSKCLPTPADEAEMAVSTAQEAASSATVEAEKVRPAGQADVSAPSRGVTSEPGVLQEVRLQQLQRILEPGSALRAHQPFTLSARLHFEVAPTTKDLDIDNSTYDVRVVAADMQRNSVLSRNGAAAALLAGVRDYENEISMAGLGRGTYLVRIRAFARYSGIDESEDIEVTVE